MKHLIRLTAAVCAGMLTVFSSVSAAETDDPVRMLRDVLLGRESAAAAEDSDQNRGI